MRTGRNTKRQHNYYVKIRFLLNWQWVLSDILGENSIKKRRSNSFQKAFERRLCFDRMAGVTGIFERISFLLQKSLFVFHDHRISFCGIYLESDVVVYDVKNKEILSKASLITKDAFETFPAFSPDGKWLYFCTAPAQKMPENYDKVRYNLCRVAFDPDRGEISFPIDTLVHADSLSYTFPRISPDGRFLMYTETAYGQFPIWHPDAEIRMMDLENRTAMDMSALNSPDTDSYHSWSSNSDWVVFSSRRDNGLYTLPYICHIGKDGKPSKPFLLPQEDPDKYDYQLYSYNIPELTKGAVEVSPYEIQQVAEKNKPEQVRFK